MNFFTLHYWFSSYNEPFLFWSARIVLGVLLLFFLAGCLAHYFSRQHEDRYVRLLFRRLRTWALTFSLLQLCFLFFTQENIPFLGARFWYLLIGFLWFIWLIWIFRYHKKIVPEKRQRAQERVEFEKYLP